MKRASFHKLFAPILALSLAIPLFGTSLVGCVDPSDTTEEPAPEERGDILSTELIATLSRQELQDIVTAIGMPGLEDPRNGVAFHRIVYRTPDVDGQLTSASGLVLVPDGEGPFPALSDQHGTQVLRRETISDPLLETEMGGVALLFASQGWVVVGADYLGLGVSEGLHPYYHAATEASASLDFLRAARRFLDEKDVDLTGELFLGGYSQGAHVTMALHRALDRDPVPGWTVIASAPMAGAYNLADVSLPAALTKPSPSSSLYVAYALLAYERVYEDAPRREEVFQAPYIEQVATLFDGTHQIQEIMAALPATPAELLQPAFVEAYLSDESHPLRDRLRENDVLDWSPGAPIRLFHGKADKDVPFENSEYALSVLRDRGAEVELVNVGDDLDHATASMPSFFAARSWFETLRATP